MRLLPGKFVTWTKSIITIHKYYYRPCKWILWVHQRDANSNSFLTWIWISRIATTEFIQISSNFVRVFILPVPTKANRHCLPFLYEILGNNFRQGLPSKSIRFSPCHHFWELKYSKKLCRVCRSSRKRICHFFFQKWTFGACIVAK